MKRSSVRVVFTTVCGVLLVCLVFPVLLCGAQLQVGAASVDITPNKAVALWGQFAMRLCTKPDTPLTANVVALQSGETRTTLVSLDLLQCPDVFVQAIRDAVADKDASIDVQTIVLTATHTHTAPVLVPGTPGIPVNDQTMTVEETISFLADRISDGIVAAWKDLAPGKMSYGLDRNSIGFGRRAVYADGSAQMYGNTNRPDFMNLEGMDDDDVGSIFLLRCAGQPESGRDQRRLPGPGGRRPVLHQRGLLASGAREAAGPLRGRAGRSGLGSGGRRHLPAADPAPGCQRPDAGAARHQRNAGTGPAHRLVGQPDLRRGPEREIRRPGLETRRRHVAVAVVQDHRGPVPTGAGRVQPVVAQVENDPASAARVAFMARNWHHGVVRRYELLQQNPDATHPVEIHVVRLGDLVICSNPFELFCEYGIRIKARSKATQTFILQMTGFGSYLPTERALAGGSYSAIPQSNVIGPEGGQMLVDETVAIIDELWK
jgi:hypothetical protein